MNKRVLRGGVTIGILLVLFWKISFSHVIRIIMETDPIPLIVSTPLIALLYAFRTAKWQMMLRYVGIETDFMHNYKSVMKGMFYGLATPGRAGELARALLFEKKSAVFATVVWEKITDAFFVVLLCAFSLLFFFQNWSLFLLITGAALAVILTSMILIHGKTISYITSLFAIPLTASQDYFIYSRRFAKDMPLNAKMMIPTIAYYADCFGIAFLILRALNPSLPAMLIFSLPIIILLGNVPISFSGIGVREMVTSITFHAVGADPAYGASYGFLLFFMITVIPGLVGGVLHYCET